MTGVESHAHRIFQNVQKELSKSNVRHLPALGLEELVRLVDRVFLDGIVRKPPKSVPIEKALAVSGD